MNSMYVAFMIRTVLETAAFFFLIAMAIVAMQNVSKARPWVPVFAGLFILAGLFVPVGLLGADFDYPGPDWVKSAIQLAIFIFMLLGLFMAGSLFIIGLSNPAEQPAEGRGYRPACLLLGAAILARIAFNIYWLIVWDSTTDSLDFFWIILPEICALAAGAGVIIGLRRWRKLAGLLYLVIVTAGILAVYQVAEPVDFRALTARRAAAVTAALETYYQHTGSYPASLRQLPWYQRLALSGPVILFYGQDWCYQGGQDYYHFGYLDRPHWSAPIRFGHLVSSRGPSPLKSDVCQAQIDSILANHPDWTQTLQDYGQPTPTPDLGE